jgi:hypothetical protein
MGGHHADAVLATYAPESGGVYDADFVQTVRRQLAAVGIAVRVVPLRQGSSPARWAAVLAGADMARTGGSTDDDSLAFLLHLPYLPATYRAQLDRLSSISTPNRVAMADLAARRLERAAVYVGVADGATPELVSKRIGCIVHQPQYPGLDLAASCLR